MCAFGNGLLLNESKHVHPIARKLGGRSNRLKILCVVSAVLWGYALACDGGDPGTIPLVEGCTDTSDPIGGGSSSSDLLVVRKSEDKEALPLRSLLDELTSLLDSDRRLLHHDIGDASLPDSDRYLFDDRGGGGNRRYNIDGTAQRADYVTGGTEVWDFKATGYLLWRRSEEGLRDNTVPAERRRGRDVYTCLSFCTVGLVSPNVAITAAHCLFQSPGWLVYGQTARPMYMAVGFGRVCQGANRNSRTDVPCPSGENSPVEPVQNPTTFANFPRYNQIYRVVYARPAPGYNNAGALPNHDLAYLILDRAVRGITPASMSQDTSNGVTKPCNVGYMIGYGGVNQRKRVWLNYTVDNGFGDVRGDIVLHNNTGTQTDGGDSGSPVYGWYRSGARIQTPPGARSVLPSMAIVALHRGLTLQANTPVAGIMLRAQWSFIQAGIQQGRVALEWARRYVANNSGTAAREDSICYGIDRNPNLQ